MPMLKLFQNKKKSDQGPQDIKADVIVDVENIDDAVSTSEKSEVHEESNDTEMKASASYPPLMLQHQPKKQWGRIGQIQHNEIGTRQF